MTAHPPGKCCVSGHIHQGTPKGEMTTFAGVSTYISKPASPSSHALLFLSDACGHAFINNQLLADEYASAGGYTVFMPDQFHGDPHGFGRDDIDVYERLELHPPSRVEPVVEAVLDGIKSQSFQTICAVGFCFGAKYVTRLLGREDSGIAAAYEAHPSFVSAEELKAIKKPLSIAAAETDDIFTTEKRRESEDILKSIGVPYQINLYSGVEHSFTVRSDLSDRRQKWAKEQAFLQSLAWFEEWRSPQ